MPICNNKCNISAALNFYNTAKRIVDMGNPLPGMIKFF